MNGAAGWKRTLGLSLLLLLGGLGAVAATPGGRSLLYPRARAVLRFSHAGAHSKQRCQRCHRDVERSIAASDRHVPREASCQPCHRKKTRQNELERMPTGARVKACASCHQGYRGGAAPARLNLPAARLRFSHRLHHDKGVGCTTCHAVQKGRPAMPSMASCLSCHRRQRASLRCATCHLTRKDGRLRTRFGLGRLRPQGSVIGARHTPAFERRGHASLARMHRKTCETCHRPATCLRCHAGSSKPLRIHRSDYLTHHAMDARLDQPRCSSCHRSQSFCLSCHLRSGVSSGSRAGGFKPSTGRSFHPKGFNAQTAGPGHHASAARRNVRTCTSCHSEKSCIRCHGTVSKRGGGFSPHGPGFALSAKCRSLSARSPRVCAKCHRAGDPKLRCR